MSHGLRLEDLAWQAFQAGARTEGVALDDPGAFEHVKDKFVAWWTARREQGCALPECLKCGFDPGAAVTASWTFVIERDPPSLNARIFNAGPRRWAYAKEREAWYVEFVNARNTLRIPHAETKRRVTLTRMFDGRQKQRDIDNLWGGGKSCVDAMVLAQILVSDAPDFAEVHWMQERGTSGLRVLLEELAA
jgi:hypothetical protein